MVYMQCGAFDAGLAFSTRGLEIARRSRHATGFERVAFNLVDQADGFLSRGDLALAPTSSTRPSTSCSIRPSRAG